MTGDELRVMAGMVVDAGIYFIAAFALWWQGRHYYLTPATRALVNVAIGFYAGYGLAFVCLLAAAAADSAYWFVQVYNARTVWLAAGMTLMLTKAARAINQEGVARGKFR